MQQWEYLTLEFSFRPFKKLRPDLFFNSPSVNGQRQSMPGKETLHEFLNSLGMQGWELVSHTASTDVEGSISSSMGGAGGGMIESAMLHILIFKRPKH
jgi:hypothetical protein